MNQFGTGPGEERGENPAAHTRFAALEQLLSFAVNASFNSQ
jgi:hypothetical protein